MTPATLHSYKVKNKILQTKHKETKVEYIPQAIIR